MKKYLPLIVLLALSGCSTVKHPELLGVWKSNEEMTLSSLAGTEGVNPNAKELFSKDFFGKLQVEYRQSTYRAMFDSDEDNIEEFEQFYPYQVQRISENQYLVKSEAPFEENEEKHITIEGDCYYVLISKWQFREYFCRVPTASSRNPAVNER